MPFTKDFIKLERRIEENYLGRPVPTRFQKEFGKIYNIKEIRPLTFKIAKSRGIQIEKHKLKRSGTGGDLNE